MDQPESTSSEANNTVLGNEIRQLVQATVIEVASDPVATANRYQEENTKLWQDNNLLHGHLTHLQTQINDAQGHNKQLQGQLNNKETYISQIEYNLHRKQQELNAVISIHRTDRQYMNGTDFEKLNKIGTLEAENQRMRLDIQQAIQDIRQKSEEVLRLTKDFQVTHRNLVIAISILDKYKISHPFKRTVTRPSIVEERYLPPNVPQAHLQGNIITPSSTQHPLPPQTPQQPNEAERHPAVSSPTHPERQGESAAHPPQSNSIPPHQRRIVQGLSVVQEWARPSHMEASTSLAHQSIQQATPIHARPSPASRFISGNFTLVPSHKVAIQPSVPDSRKDAAEERPAVERQTLPIPLPCSTTQPFMPNSRPDAVEGRAAVELETPYSPLPNFDPFQRSADLHISIPRSAGRAQSLPLPRDSHFPQTTATQSRSRTLPVENAEQEGTTPGCLNMRPSFGTPYFGASSSHQIDAVNNFPGDSIEICRPTGVSSFDRQTNPISSPLDSQSASLHSRNSSLPEQAITPSASDAPIDQRMDVDLPPTDPTSADNSETHQEAEAMECDTSAIAGDRLGHENFHSTRLPSTSPVKMEPGIGDSTAQQDEEDEEALPRDADGLVTVGACIDLIFEYNADESARYCELCSSRNADNDEKDLQVFPLNTLQEELRRHAEDYHLDAWNMLRESAPDVEESS